MDIVKMIDKTCEFCSNSIEKVVDLWDSFDEEKKKLFVGCAAIAVAVIVIAGIAYGLGVAHGKKTALEEEF